jgi:hypothetical protein
MERNRWALPVERKPSMARSHRLGVCVML